MSYLEYRSGETLMDMRLEGSQNWALDRAQLRQAGLTRQPWMSRQRHRLADRASRLTVTLTSALERLGKLESFPQSG